MNPYEQKINDQRFLIETQRAAIDQIVAENKRLREALRIAEPYLCTAITRISKPAMIEKWKEDKRIFEQAPK